MLKSDDKMTLRLYLEGSATDIGSAVRRLSIERGEMSLAQVAEQLSDEIKPCRYCKRWTDVDVIDKSLCPRCDAILNPENHERPHD